MKNKSITFETFCYFGDEEVFEKTDRLEKQIEACGCEFDHKVLYINNVKNLDDSKKKLAKKVEDGTIDEVASVEDYSKDALKFFNTPKESFKEGYKYSICSMVGIFRCKTKYLVHFSGDSCTEADKKYSWIKSGIELLEKRPDIAVVSPVWNFQKHEAKRESFEFDGQYGLSYGFSDQCYLIRVDEFKRRIYNFKNEASERYPKYGGELFEKRVDAYLRDNRRLRAIDFKANYISLNIKNIEEYKKSQMKFNGHKYKIERKIQDYKKMIGRRI